MKFKVICDTACGLSLEYARRNDVTLVPFYVTFDGKQYFKEQVEVEQDEFYRRMIIENAYPKSSMPNVQDFIDAFKPCAQQKIPIICICISTLFSGSYNSASEAREQLLEEFPDARITVLDSLLNSSSEALFVREAVRMRDDQVSYEDAVTVLTKMRPLGRIFFTIDSLDYLRKSGRIGKLGSLNNRMPGVSHIIVMKNGELHIGGTSRSRKQAIRTIIEVCFMHFTDNHLIPPRYNFNVASGSRFEERDEFRDNIEFVFRTRCVERLEEFPTRIGVTTACYTGPFVLGVGIMPKYETLLDK